MSPYLSTIVNGTFTKPVHIGDLGACEQQGEAAGDQAYKRDANPYAAGTAEREWWDAGWSKSYDELTGND